MAIIRYNKEFCLENGWPIGYYEVIICDTESDDPFLPMFLRVESVPFLAEGI